LGAVTFGSDPTAPPGPVFPRAVLVWEGPPALSVGPTADLLESPFRVTEGWWRIKK